VSGELLLILDAQTLGHFYFLRYLMVWLFSVIRNSRNIQFHRIAIAFIVQYSSCQKPFP
jgi:hypothetical protein